MLTVGVGDDTGFVKGQLQVDHQRQGSNVEYTPEEAS